MLNSLFNEKLNLTINPFTKNFFTFITTILLLLILLNIYNEMKLMNYIGIMIIIFICVLAMVKIDEKLLLSYKIKSKKVKFSKLYDKINTGDLYLCVTNFPKDVIKIIIFTIFISLYSDKYFTHVGIIFKDEAEKKIYLLENLGAEYHKCIIVEKIKSGPLIREFNIDIENKINKQYNMEKKSLIFPTNMHKYIDNYKLLKVFNEFKDLEYNEFGLNCCTFLYNILRDNNLLKDKFDNYIILTPDFFINEKNYLIDIEINKEPIEVILN
jgi:hypothetical protein